MMQKYSNILDNYLANYISLDDKFGIVTGESGLVLLLAQLYHYKKNQKYLHQMDLLIDKITAKKKSDFSLGYGWCGFAWVLFQIEKLKILENINEWLIELDFIIEKEFWLMMNNENLDYFDGASGLLFYFLEKDESSDKINKMVDAYIKSVTEKIENNNWEKEDFDPLEKKYCKTINLGTPHGIPGLLLITLLIHQNKLYDCQNIINQLIDVLLLFKTKDENLEYNFPSRIIDGRKTISDMAWCYGDLMIGYGILKAGYLLNDDSYKNYAMEILTESLTRGNQRKDNLILCHGYTSLSHIYKSIFKMTGDSRFKVRSEYWQKASIDFFEKSHYHNLNPDKYEEFKQDPSLFFGFSGFFLSLLAWEYGDNTEWINCLLL